METNEDGTVTDVYVEGDIEEIESTHCTDKNRTNQISDPTTLCVIKTQI